MKNDNELCSMHIVEEVCPLKPCQGCGFSLAEIEREAAIAFAKDIIVPTKDGYDYRHRCIDPQDILELPAADVVTVPPGGIGELSDGYHTFNGLYYQRMVLFAALVKAYKDMAWKSWRHEDGELCFGKDNYFIVGIDTPQGSYTYHYHGEHWDLFDCEELPVAKHWDGHTEADVTRLLFLPDVAPVVRCKDCKIQQYCKVAQYLGMDGFCSNGAKMDEEEADVDA